ncbi:hypothetical protein PHJA_002189600, partial [Phtheirospermum japonicum]
LVNVQLECDKRRSSLESLFCYDKPIPEEIIEEPIGISWMKKILDIILIVRTVNLKEIFFAPLALDRAYMWSLSWRVEESL